MEIENEKKRFDKYNALSPVLHSLVPKDVKIMTTTWAMKKKASGTYQGRLNVRGYKQVDGMHYFGIILRLLSPMLSLFNFC